MIEQKVSPPESFEEHHLTCMFCGFSMTARNKAVLVNAHDTLWNYFPDNEAV